MLKTTQKLIAVAKISARANLAYPGEVLGRATFLLVILYIFLKLWQATYSESGQSKLAGLSLAEMLWYLTITESMWMSAPKLAQQVDEDVRTGSLSVKLIRPLSYPLYCLSANLGERLVRFAFNLALGACIALALVGPIQLRAEALLMLAAAVSLAFLLDGLGHLLVGLSAFWLEDTSGLYLIYTRLTMILGGMLIPLDLFPGWLKNLVVYLPFPYLVWGPVHLLSAPSPQLATSFLELAFRQLFCLAALSGLVALIWQRALKRVSAHGG